MGLALNFISCYSMGLLFPFFSLIIHQTFLAVSFVVVIDVAVKRVA